MSSKIYPIPFNAKQAYISEKKYREWYTQSIDDPETFWSLQAKKFITWNKEWNQVLTGDLNSLNVQWFVGGQLNVAFNCLDRHLENRAKQTAIIWEGDGPNETQYISYQDLFERVCRFANVLKRFGIKKGDTVCIYLPMIPEAAIAMLATARIGAIHSVVFAGFSADSLKSRIQDAKCKLVITANEGLRGTKIIPLKKNVDAALNDCPTVKNVIIVRRTDADVKFIHERDHWYHNLITHAPATCSQEIMDAQDPLFILYTSGSTGKPKGILHTTGGYSVWAAITHKYVFDYHPHEVYWCTADVGWITGHTYGIYGPLLNGATTVMFEGVPHYPTPARFWEIVDKHKVNIFYTAPTALRALRQQGDDWIKRTKRTSLRILGSVGEPINPEVWEWYFNVVGEKRCAIVDTWWQTETGGIMITPFPGATTLKPGSASYPFFGIVPAIVNDEGQELPANQMGKLVIKKPWPGMMQTVFGDHQRFVETYFAEFPGCYSTGDLAHRDQEGYFWITGRSDDVIKISGHRIGTEEIESALVSHPKVSEAAVVAVPDAIKGQAIYAFITLIASAKGDEILRKELVETLRNIIGPIASPEYIQWSTDLPKTRSGKIMRRLLRKIANDDTENLDDLSTLADPNVVQDLMRDKLKLK